jgi:hypothetical protein
MIGFQRWRAAGFLTGHARVLLCIAHDPGARLRDIAASMDITEHSAYGIAADLAEAGATARAGRPSLADKLHRPAGRPWLLRRRRRLRPCRWPEESRPPRQLARGIDVGAGAFRRHVGGQRNRDLRQRDAQHGEPGRGRAALEFGHSRAHAMPFCLSAGGRADPGSSRCLRPFGLLRQRAHLPPCGACNDYRLAITGLEDGILDRVTSGSVRSLACIDRHDLLRLAELAAEVEAGLFARNPQGAGRYAGRLLCRALCQGAALHYLNTTNGVKDFDVWSFYAERDDGLFPYRWRGTADFGPFEIRKISRRPAIVHRPSRRPAWAFARRAT